MRMADRITAPWHPCRVINKLGSVEVQQPGKLGQGVRTGDLNVAALEAGIDLS